jgi:predicted nucleic acid-binding protein
VVQTAREMGTDYVLIDERKARKIARSVYGLNVIGTARLLVEAKKNGLIDSVGDMIDKLRDGGYWIGDSIVQRMLKEAGET